MLFTTPPSDMTQLGYGGSETIVPQRLPPYTTGLYTVVYRPSPKPPVSPGMTPWTVVYNALVYGDRFAVLVYGGASRAFHGPSAVVAMGGARWSRGLAVARLRAGRPRSPLVGV